MWKQILVRARILYVNGGLPKCSLGPSLPYLPVELMLTMEFMITWVQRRILLGVFANCKGITYC